ncbi:MAG: hypothetical protein ACR2ND_08915 [Solirubrobacteraceae bacterium]
MSRFARAKGRSVAAPLFAGAYLATWAPRASIDLPVGLAIVGLGIVILGAPASIPLLGTAM